jgi:hypothetical protein
MEKSYEELRMEVVLFNTEDVISDSIDTIVTDDNMGQWLP